jgi:hypothetical protein
MNRCMASYFPFYLNSNQLRTTGCLTSYSCKKYQMWTTDCLSSISVKNTQLWTIPYLPFSATSNQLESLAGGCLLACFWESKQLRYPWLTSDYLLISVKSNSLWTTGCQYLPFFVNNNQLGAIGYLPSYFYEKNQGGTTGCLPSLFWKQ